MASYQALREQHDISLRQIGHSTSHSTQRQHPAACTIPGLSHSRGEAEFSGFQVQGAEYHHHHPPETCFPRHSFVQPDQPLSLSALQQQSQNKYTREFFYFILHLYLYIVHISSGGWGKTKLKLTTHFHVFSYTSCVDFNSYQLHSHSSVSWRVRRLPLQQQRELSLPA